jgi:hypothetical protein
MRALPEASTPANEDAKTREQTLSFLLKPPPAPTTSESELPTPEGCGLLGRYEFSGQGRELYHAVRIAYISTQETLHGHLSGAIPEEP